MAIDINADFTPTIPDSGVVPTKLPYNPTGSFKFWAQKVLPLVYDDSLSYYEVLCKVVDYLNNVIQNVDNLNDSVDSTNQSFATLEEYVNTTKDTIIATYNELQDYVNTYFDNLDVQQEINEKLDAMADSGELTTLLAPFIPDLVTSWLNTHVNPVGSAVMVDNTLNISGAAADAKVTGNKIGDLKADLSQVGTTDIKLFSKVAEHKSIELPITWVQGVWGANGAEELSTRIRSANLYTYNEAITFKVRNTGTGTIAYTKYSDNGHTRVDTGYVSNSITLDSGYYYGFWMQASNSTSDILPTAGDAVSFCVGMTKGHAVFIGDSYTEGLGLDSSSDRWSTKVCASLGLTEHNYGVGGTGFYVGHDNNTDFIHQVVNAMNDSSFRNVDVKYVFIAGGRNDASDATAMAFSQSQVQSLVSSVIDGVQNNFPNATIILIPMMFDADIIPQYIFSWYQKIIVSCRSFYRNVRIVKGAYTWLTGSFGFIQSDGIHPNSAGHNIIATNVIDCLNGGDGQNNIGEYTIAYNQSAINNNPAMGVVCDGKKVFLQSSLIRTIDTIPAGTALFTETYNSTFIIGWCKPQKIYFTIYNIENGQSYSVYFTMSKTDRSYTASLIANEPIPLGRYSLYGEYDLGRYLNVATGD